MAEKMDSSDGVSRSRKGAQPWVSEETMLIRGVMSCFFADDLSKGSIAKNRRNVLITLTVIVLS